MVAARVGDLGWAHRQRSEAGMGKVGKEMGWGGMQSLKAANLMGNKGCSLCGVGSNARRSSWVYESYRYHSREVEPWGLRHQGEIRRDGGQEVRGQQEVRSFISVWEQQKS